MKRTKIILLLMLSFLALGKTAMAQNPGWPNINSLPPICEEGTYSRADFVSCLDSVGGIPNGYSFDRIKRKQAGSPYFFDVITPFPFRPNPGDSIKIIIHGSTGMGLSFIESDAIPVNIVNHSRITIPDTACDSYYWPQTGDTYTTSGTRTFTAHGVDPNGCDSIYTLALIINRSTSSSTTSSVCDSLVWHGTTYRTGGSYTWDTTNAVGCDSTVTLGLHVRQSTHNVYTETKCDSYHWRGRTYYTSGVYTYNYDNSVACPSTDTLHLTINSSNSGVETVTACDSYTWWNTTYTNSTNTPTHIYTNAAGCDSTVTLHLTINRSSSTTETITACDSCTWHNQTFTHSNNQATYTTTNVAGCDSTVTLHLTVRYSTHNSFTETACDSYTWHSIPRTTSAVYTYGYTNLAGCPSVDTLHLTIHYSNATTLTETACDRYVWHDSIFTRSTVTSVTTFNSQGCDSTITLHLTVNYSSTATDIHDVCDSLRWHGVLYRTSTTLPTYSTTNAAGCDSTVTLDLTVRYATHEHLFMTTCESYTWERTGQVYTMSGLYPSDTYTNAAGCPSIDTLHLVVYGAAIPEQRELVVKNLGTATPQMIIYPRTPGEKEYAYQWYRDSNIIEDAHLQYYRFGKEDKGKHTFSVYVSPIEQKLCGSTSSIQLTVKPSVKSFLALSPNPAKESFTVNLTAEDEQMAEVSIFNTYGTCVLTLPAESDHIQVNSMLPKGVYMVRVTTTQGNIYTDKLIVQ